MRTFRPFFAWGFGGHAHLRLGVVMEAWDGGLRGLFAFLICRRYSYGYGDEMSRPTVPDNSCSLPPASSWRPRYHFEYRYLTSRYLRAFHALAFYKMEGQRYYPANQQTVLLDGWRKAKSFGRSLVGRQLSRLVAVVVILC